MVEKGTEAGNGERGKGGAETGQKRDHAATFSLAGTRSLPLPAVLESVTAAVIYELQTKWTASTVAFFFFSGLAHLTPSHVAHTLSCLVTSPANKRRRLHGVPTFDQPLELMPLGLTRRTARQSTPRNSPSSRSPPPPLVGTQRHYLQSRNKRNALPRFVIFLPPILLLPCPVPRPVRRCAVLRPLHQPSQPALFQIFPSKAHTSIPYLVHAVHTDTQLTKKSSPSAA